MLAGLSRNAWIGLLAESLWIGANVSVAADYPNKPIRLIVPYAAGGATDVTSRTIAPRLSEKLEQQIIVDNRPGGGAILSMRRVAKAPADGYSKGSSSRPAHPER
jgi:tripartite-type tricarboxylate transporter receptor subunit TctC